MTKYYCFLTFLFLQLCFTACSDDIADKPDPFDGRVQDPCLVGNWSKDNNSGITCLYEALNLYADGTGQYAKGGVAGTLKWAASNDSIALKLDDGTLVNTHYSVRGCELAIGDVGCFKTEMQLTGQWFAKDLNGEKQDKRYSYTFGSDGKLSLEYFDDKGVWHKNGELSWWRTGENSVKIYGNGHVGEQTFSVKDGVLSLSDGGIFIRESRWMPYGTWTSVYSESGDVVAGQYPYTTITITKRSIDYGYAENNVYDHFCIEGVNESGDKFNREFKCKFSSTNDIVLYIDGVDAKLISYRLRYDSAKDVCYMEVCANRDFSHYVGYAKNQ